jgi:hypothetical protein
VTGIDLLEFSLAQILFFLSVDIYASPKMEYILDSINLAM